MPEYLCPTPESLEIASQGLLSHYPQGGVFLLKGEMGAGKTTFVREVCRQLGAEGASSPTFSLVNEYVTSQGMQVIHMDLYRIRSMEEALDFGFEEYLNRTGYLFIEWPDHVETLTGDEAVEIRILPTESGRLIAFSEK
jgi:tRNA threonylcarbamoyladenosine biosynthesis protein TsaE